MITIDDNIKIVILIYYHCFTDEQRPTGRVRCGVASRRSPNANGTTTVKWTATAEPIHLCGRPRERANVTVDTDNERRRQTRNNNNCNYNNIKSQKFPDKYYFNITRASPTGRSAGARLRNEVSSVYLLYGFDFFVYYFRRFTRFSVGNFFEMRFTSA